MINCIPKTEEGLEILQRLLVIIKNSTTKEITCSLNGQRINVGINFNYSLITTPMETYARSINEEGEIVKNYDLIYSEWVKNVGGAQKMLPMHIVNEYFCTIPLYPNVDFSIQPHSVKPNYWFRPNLGKTFALYTGQMQLKSPFTVIAREAPHANATEHDLEAIQILLQTRVRDRLQLQSILTKKVSEIIQLKSKAPVLEDMHIS